MRVVLEIAPKRTFASGLDWPGWARSGRTEDVALETLLAYAPRYAPVARRAGVPFHLPTDAGAFEVVERLEGGGTTEFGAPGAPAQAEEEPVDAADLDRLVALLRAAWDGLDAAADAARDVQLTKGPRGGGRELDKIVDHVRDAEIAYLGQLGSRPPADNALGAVHDAFVEALTARVQNQPLPNPRPTKRPWTPRYAVRRTAWHVLDHAWEIEDRSS